MGLWFVIISSFVLLLTFKIEELVIIEENKCIQERFNLTHLFYKIYNNLTEYSCDSVTVLSFVLDKKNVWLRDMLLMHLI